MNYSEMSDFDVCCLVASKVYPDSEVLNSNGECVVNQSFGCYEYFNPCNSWADAGPIIEKHMICLAADVFAQPQDGGKWVAQPAYGWQHERVRHDNPLRAAMIVFLMMQESR